MKKRLTTFAAAIGIAASASAATLKLTSVSTSMRIPDGTTVKAAFRRTSS